MLQRLNALQGGSVLALDGEIGHINEFYFDDDTWTVRYMVVDTGKWLPGRSVLIPMWALLEPDWAERRVPVRLTREQVRNSPDVSTHQPVSRREEASMHAYYGYPFYWGGPALWGPVGAPGLLVPPPAGVPGTAGTAPDDPRDTHLRSTSSVDGYHVRTRDGEQGHVDDFLADAATWHIEQLLVDTSNWPGGRAVMIPTDRVEKVDWLTGTVDVTMTRDEVRDAPGLSDVSHEPPTVAERATGEETTRGRR